MLQSHHTLIYQTNTQQVIRKQNVEKFEVKYIHHHEKQAKLLFLRDGRCSAKTTENKIGSNICKDKKIYQEHSVHTTEENKIIPLE